MAINFNPSLPSLNIPAAGAPAAPEKPAASFNAVFEDAVFRVESYQKQSQNSVNRFLNGEDEDIHTMALAGQRSELAFDLFMQTRNKIVSAYQEVMRMQL